MGLVKNRRLAAMRKQTAYAKASTFAKATVDKTGVRQRAKAGMKSQIKKGGGALPPHFYKSGGKSAADFPCGGGKKGMEV